LLYAITGGILLVMLYLSFRPHESIEERLLAYGLIACAIVAFAPSTGYNYFALLILPSAVISAHWIRKRKTQGTRALTMLVAAAILLSFLPPLLPGSAVQRNVQMHSPYFFSALALFLSLAIALGQKT